MNRRNGIAIPDVPLVQGIYQKLKCLLDNFQSKVYDAHRYLSENEKLITADQKTEDEERTKKTIDEGIIKRLNTAREFYRNLLLEMNRK